MLNPLAPSGAIACEMSAPLKRISLVRPPGELGVNVPRPCVAVWRSSAPR
jgi:hypothetical protein